MKKTKGERARFTREEDMLLKSLVEFSFGLPDWKNIAQRMLGRSPRQCRERYQNYLGPNIIKRGWTPEEDMIIMTKYNEIGPKWEYISKMLTGRSGNDTRNRYLTITRKFKKEISNQSEKTCNSSRKTAELDDKKIIQFEKNTSPNKVSDIQSESKDDAFKQMFSQQISMFCANDDCLDPFEV